MFIWLESRKHATVELIRKRARWDNLGIDDVRSHNNRSNTGGEIVVSSCQLTRTRDFGRQKLQELVIFFETRRSRYRGYVQLSGEK